MPDMTALDLAELAKLEREAADAAWEFDGWEIHAGDGETIAEIVASERQPVGDIIAALRNAAPALIARARRADELEAENERLREFVLDKTFGLPEGFTCRVSLINGEWRAEIGIHRSFGETIGLAMRRVEGSTKLR